MKLWMSWNIYLRYEQQKKKLLRSTLTFQEIVDEEFLIPEILKLDISEEDMEREHR